MSFVKIVEVVLIVKNVIVVKTVCFVLSVKIVKIVKIVCVHMAWLIDNLLSKINSIKLKKNTTKRLKRCIKSE